MGATIFFLVMILLPVAGISAIIFGAFLLITKVKWGKTPAIISISVGCICMLLFAGSFLFLRYANGQPEEGYVDTGTMVKWQGNTFTYQGEKYVPLYDDEDDGAFSYYPAVDEAKLEVAFNIEPKPEFWSVIFNVNDAENVYKVNSGEGTILYYNYYIYCPESKKEQIRQYYETNKAWSVVMGLYEDDESEISIGITSAEEKDLYDLENKNTVHLAESQIREYADLKMTTSDRVIECYAGLFYDGEKWYLDTDEVSEDSEEMVYLVYELPEILNEKIIQAVKNEVN